MAEEPRIEEPEVVEPAAREAPPAEAKEPSKAGRFLRRMLRWLVMIVVLFGLGVGATWFTQVQPKIDEIESLRSDLEAAQTQITSLESEVNRLRSVEQENQDLRTELERALRRLDLLAVLVDVTTAQLAIAQEEPIEAKVALEDTDAKLEDLQSRLSGQQAETVAGLRDRLSLAIGEVETDIFAAQRDLEILANTLVDLDRQLQAD